MNRISPSVTVLHQEVSVILEKVFSFQAMTEIDDLEAQLMAEEEAQLKVAFPAQSPP